MSLPPSDARTRIFVKVKNSDIPGALTDRLPRLIKDVYQYLGREFSITTDYVHVPGNIDTEDSQTAWLVIDTHADKAEDQDNIQTYCFRVSYLNAKP
jgi:hypothetical protein